MTSTSLGYEHLVRFEKDNALKALITPRRPTDTHCLILLAISDIIHNTSRISISKCMSRVRVLAWFITPSTETVLVPQSVTSSQAAFLMPPISIFGSGSNGSGSSVSVRKTATLNPSGRQATPKGLLPLGLLTSHEYALICYTLLWSSIQQIVCRDNSLEQTSSSMDPDLRSNPKPQAG